MEEWRKIPGWPEWYEVSNCGNVRTWHPSGSATVMLETPVLKKVRRDKSGYRAVTLRGLDKKKVEKKIGQLVLTAFDGPCPEGREMSHLFGKDDERVEALAWETPEQNMDRERAWPGPRQYKVRRDKVEFEGKAEDRRVRRIIRQGKCVRCQNPRNLFKRLCDECQEKANEYQRKKLGLKAWMPGSRGTPPKNHKGSAITPKQEEALRLSEEGKSYAEIGLILGIRPEAVSNRVYKARKHQRKEGAVDDHTFREMARSFYAVFHAKSAFLIVTGDPREAIGVWEIEGKE
jgi:hypothetical protein